MPKYMALKKSGIERGDEMEQMTRLALPTDEWKKMMCHHKIIEEYKMQVKIFGEEPALTLLHVELKKLQASRCTN